MSFFSFFKLLIVTVTQCSSLGIDSLYKGTSIASLEFQQILFLGNRPFSMNFTDSDSDILEFASLIRMVDAYRAW